MNIANLIKTKTFWVGVAGLVTAAGGWATGEITVGVAIQTALTSLVGIFLRDAITKV